MEQKIKYSKALWELSLTVILTCLSISGASAQDKIQVLGTNFQKGFIWAHYSELTKINTQNPYGVSLEWSRINTSKKAWENCNCFSKIGAGINYFNFGNPDVLGNGYTIYAFAEPFLTLGNPFYISSEIGIGATYLNQVYDEITNPENLHYSTPLSFLLTAGLTANYRLNETWNISLTGQYNHISNGGIKKPNKGMNYPAIASGIDYNLNYSSLKPYKNQEVFKREIALFGRLFYTMPDVTDADGTVSDRSWLFGLAGGARWQFRRFNALSIGLEAVLDNSYRLSSKNSGEDHGGFITSLIVGHNFLFGRFSFNQLLGVYLSKPENYTSHNLYQRYELMYFIRPQLTFGASLKSHAEVAENFDIRIGILF